MDVPAAAHHAAQEGALQTLPVKTPLDFAAALASPVLAVNTDLLACCNFTPFFKTKNKPRS
jgi:hypothetical protein